MLMTRRTVQENRVLDMFYGLLLAFQFLTRIPIPMTCPWNAQTMRWAARCYSIVGLVVGVFLVGIIHLLLSDQHVLPIWLVAMILLSVWVWLTGGLHLDGWMDVADAIGSNAPLEKKWQIMKDPHVGSFGIISLFFLLAWKGSMLYHLSVLSFPPFDAFGIANLVLPSTILFPCVVLVPAFARWGSMALLFFLPSAKKEGLAWEWKKNLSIWDLFIGILPILLFLWFFPETVPLFLLLCLFLVGYSFWVLQTFKGINGDLTGAFIEGGELWGLIVIYIWFVMA
jgi:adenosylcobinamide-GDP ribazoletransferase